MKRILILSAFAIFILITTIISRSFRVEKIPNGNKFMCANCHINPSGGGERNAFGKAVGSRVTPGGFQDFWDSQLASLDSDGDGFSNGLELQDPAGSWRPGQPNPGNTSQVSNPGDPSSVPNISLVESSSLAFYYKLYDNYPNPFNPSTRISFVIPVNEKVTLNIFDINGSLIKTLVNDNLSPGTYEMLWNAKDENNNDVTSGVYIYQLRAGYFNQSKKMVLIRWKNIHSFFHSFI